MSTTSPWLPHVEIRAPILRTGRRGGPRSASPFRPESCVLRLPVRRRRRCPHQRHSASGLRAKHAPSQGLVRTAGCRCGDPQHAAASSALRDERPRYPAICSLGGRSHQPRCATLVRGFPDQRMTSQGCRRHRNSALMMAGDGVPCPDSRGRRRFAEAAPCPHAAVTVWPLRPPRSRWQTSANSGRNARRV